MRFISMWNSVISIEVYKKMINDGWEKEYLDHIPYGAPPGGIIKMVPLPISFILFTYFLALLPAVIILLIINFIIIPLII
jgi:hypothetical protein